MSPPLVVAFALAGRADIDLSSKDCRSAPGGKGRPPEGHLAHVAGGARPAMQSRAFARRLPQALHRLRRAGRSGTRSRQHRAMSSKWDDKSTYIQGRRSSPNFSMSPGDIAPVSAARSASSATTVTTDHISPRTIKKSAPAGFLIENGVAFGTSTAMAPAAATTAS